MFVIFLKFSQNKANASAYLEAHNQWLKQGFDDGVFLLAGSIKPKSGGCIIAHNCSFDEITERVNNDPFVKEKVVSIDVAEIAVGKTNDALAFLLD